MDALYKVAESQSRSGSGHDRLAADGGDRFGTLVLVRTRPTQI